MTVREIDQRVLLVHVGTQVGPLTCLESEWPSSQTFHSREQRGRGFNLVPNDVDDAEGRDREQVGDEATGGKRTKGTPNKDMTKR